jgi:hypothetical protein
MPDSLILDVPVYEIFKKIAHVLNNVFAFEAAWD